MAYARPGIGSRQESTPLDRKIKGKFPLQFQPNLRNTGRALCNRGKTAV